MLRNSWENFLEIYQLRNTIYIVSTQSTLLGRIAGEKIWLNYVYIVFWCSHRHCERVEIHMVHILTFPSYPTQSFAYSVGKWSTLMVAVVLALAAYPKHRFPHTVDCSALHSHRPRRNFEHVLVCVAAVVDGWLLLFDKSAQSQRYECSAQQSTSP